MLRKGQERKSVFTNEISLAAELEKVVYVLLHICAALQNVLCLILRLHCLCSIGMQNTSAILIFMLLANSSHWRRVRTSSRISKIIVFRVRGDTKYQLLFFRRKKHLFSIIVSAENFLSNVSKMVTNYIQRKISCWKLWNSALNTGLRYSHSSTCQVITSMFCRRKEPLPR